jgi:hypothetical protein
MDAGELDDYRSGHPLAALLPMFGELLGERASDGEYIFAITDAAGTLLWVRGHRETLLRAERMNFVEGAASSGSGPCLNGNCARRCSRAPMPGCCAAGSAPRGGRTTPRHGWPFPGRCQRDRRSGPPRLPGPESPAGSSPQHRGRRHA